MTQPFRRTLYRGYSTVGAKRSFRLYDTDLVKQDILNALNTNKTERVRNANYGTTIQDSIFELGSDEMAGKLYQEVIDVISSDERVRIIDANFSREEYGILISFNLLYVGMDTQFDFKLKFDQANQLITEEV